MTSPASSSLEVFVHIPGVSIEPDVRIEYAGGSLRLLPYDRWLRLDDEVAGKRRRAYEAAQPCFYGYAANLPAPPDDEPVSISDLVTGFFGQELDSERGQQLARQLAQPDQRESLQALGRVHLRRRHIEQAAEPVRRAACEAADGLRVALILSCGAALPPLDDSITYVSGADWTGRQIGRLERRALLMPPSLTLAKSDSARLLATLHLVEDARPATLLGEVRQAIDTLGAVSLPDFEAIDELMHVAIAFEAILLADVTSGVTSAFSERGAALLADGAAEIAILRSKLASLYALRSDALHGRDVAQSLALASQSIEDLTQWTRRALVCAVRRVLHLSRGLADPAQRLMALRSELEAARGAVTVPASLIDAPKERLL